jgi:hypothetical protein
MTSKARHEELQRERRTRQWRRISWMAVRRNMSKAAIAHLKELWMSGDPGWRAALKVYPTGGGKY